MAGVTPLSQDKHIHLSANNRNLPFSSYIPLIFCILGAQEEVGVIV